MSKDGKMTNEQFIEMKADIANSVLNYIDSIEL
jgi:hypothetical protein